MGDVVDIRRLTNDDLRELCADDLDISGDTAAMARELLDLRAEVERLREGILGVALQDEGLAAGLRREVKRGVALRQSPEAKLARVSVLEANAEQLRRLLEGPDHA